MNKSKKRNRIIAFIVLVIVIAAVAVNGITSMQRIDIAFKSYIIDEGELEKFISAKGCLIGSDLQSISTLSGVKIDKVVVKEGMFVSEGDILAKLDANELNEMKLQCIKEIKELKDSIIFSDSTKDEKKTFSRVSGRVKAISQDKEDNDIIIIAVDGKMRAHIWSDAFLQIGSYVEVKLDNDEKVDGVIVAMFSGGYAVEISNDTLPIGETVEVYKDGSMIGKGVLQVNAPVAIKGDYANVETIHVKVNDKVSRGDKLITWKKAQIKEEYNNLIGQYNRLNTKLNDISKLIEFPIITTKQAGIIKDIMISDGDLLIQESDYVPIFTQILDGANIFEASISEKDIALICYWSKSTN